MTKLFLINCTTVNTETSMVITGFSLTQHGAEQVIFEDYSSLMSDNELSPVRHPIEAAGLNMWKVYLSEDPEVFLIWEIVELELDQVLNLEF